MGPVRRRSYSGPCQTHDHLDDAQDRIGELQETLRRFRTELTDISVDADIRVSIDGFLRFADFFFDGLFADWAVLDEIHASQERLSETAKQVESVMKHLSELRSALESEKRGIEDRREETVRQA